MEMNIIKNNMNRYQILVLFILFSIVLFFITRFVAGIIYESWITNDIIGQFTDAIDVAIKAFGVYLMILFAIAIIGLLISRTKDKPEYIKGFKFALLFCGIMFLGYLIILFN
jgi:hypothetical protein